MLCGVGKEVLLRFERNCLPMLQLNTWCKSFAKILCVVRSRVLCIVLCSWGNGERLEGPRVWRFADIDPAMGRRKWCQKCRGVGDTMIYVPG